MPHESELLEAFHRFQTALIVHRLRELDCLLAEAAEVEPPK